MEAQSTWHQRIPNLKHQQEFDNLCDVHNITHSWLIALKMDKPAYLLKKNISPELKDSLWMLENLLTPSTHENQESPSPSLEALLDDTQPSDVLARLNRVVWITHGLTYSAIIDKASKNHLDSTIDQLKKISWNCGKDVAQRRWPSLCKLRQDDVRTLIATLADSPFNSFLVERATQNEAVLEWRYLLWEEPFEEIKHCLDELAMIQASWIRGFCHALNTTSVVEFKKKNNRRCLYLSLASSRL